MSIRIFKAGMLDTVQDTGRFGFQHLGINPGGVMDHYAAQVTNSLAGNIPGDAVIEMHFPAATILFEQETLLALGGANFNPAINGETIPMWHPVIVSKNSILQFRKKLEGARCYLAINKGLKITGWLNSFSTNLIAGAGGFKGRSLKKDDVIRLNVKTDYQKFLQGKDFVVLPWKPDIKWDKSTDNKIQVLVGNEWDQLTDDAKKKFESELFSITALSNRMGYRLKGPSMTTWQQKELVSSAVSFGTIQWLPDGQLIVLMADHQTTGGYPRVGHVITADLPKLAQMNSGDAIHFSIIHQKKAESILINRQHHLLQLQNACKFKLSALLSF